MTLYEQKDSAVKQQAWKKFGRHHYAPTSFNPAARVFLATEFFDGHEILVGMAATLPMPSGTLQNALRSHKVVILPPSKKSGVWGTSQQVILPEFDKKELWRTLADALATKMVCEGHRYFCNASDAPPTLVAYRNDPNSGWRPTSKNGQPPRDAGHGKRYGHKSRAVNGDGLVVSHEYIGSALDSPEPAPEPELAEV